MADVRDGVGPYLSVFLKGGQHWDPGAIGVAMAASAVAAAICQVPAGLLVDGTRAKRLLVAASGLTVALGCLLIVLFPHFATVIAAQAMLGAASAVIPPAIAALSLGLVGRRLLDARISRNESFNHGGNFLAAGLAGGLGQYLGYDWIFYLVCGFAVASAGIVTLIDPAEIYHDRARGGEDPNNNCEPVPLRDLLRQRDLVIFLASVVLFHFGNAAMLPMAGQVLALKHLGSDTMALSACIIAAQLVMVGVAWGVGRASSLGVGRKTIFLVALGVLPVRGVLFSFTTSPYGVVAIQLLDGVAAGIFGVVSGPDRRRPDARNRPFQSGARADGAGGGHRRRFEQCDLGLRRAVVRLHDRLPVSCGHRRLCVDFLRAADAGDRGGGQAASRPPTPPPRPWSAARSAPSSRGGVQ